LPAQQFAHALAFGLAQRIPQGQVYTAERHHGNAAAAIGQTGEIKFVPEAADSFYTVYVAS
jgi:hypothetical protein